MSDVVDVNGSGLCHRFPTAPLDHVIVNACSGVPDISVGVFVEGRRSYPAVAFPCLPLSGNDIHTHNPRRKKEKRQDALAYSKLNQKHWILQ